MIEGGRKGRGDKERKKEKRKGWKVEGQAERDPLVAEGPGQRRTATGQVLSRHAHQRRVQGSALRMWLPVAREDLVPGCARCIAFKEVPHRGDVRHALCRCCCTGVNCAACVLPPRRPSVACARFARNGLAFASAWPFRWLSGPRRTRGLPPAAQHPAANASEGGPRAPR